MAPTILIKFCRFIAHLFEAQQYDSIVFSQKKSLKLEK